MANKEHASGKSTAGPNLALIIFAIWALIQISRLSAFSLAQDVLAGHEADAWLFPAFVDVFIGITAPFIAFAIWRKSGLAGWVSAIVWFSISVFDHLDAATAAYFTSIPKMMDMGNPSNTIMLLLGMAVLDAVIIFFLIKMRSHFLKSPH